MLTSAEVRWCFEGAIPNEIAQWVCRGGLLYKASPREDHYMLFPASLGLNIKLREGRLELKSLVKTLGLRNLAADVAGVVQIWEKRIGEDAAVEEFERLRSSAPHLWVTVGKERTVRKFSLDGLAADEVQADTVFPSNGCNVELTRITVKGSECWSFAFEAYGDPSQVEDHLRRLAERFLTDDLRPRSFRTKSSPSASFSAADSHAYSEWLDRFAKKA